MIIRYDQKYRERNVIALVTEAVSILFFNTKPAECFQEKRVGPNWPINDEEPASYSLSNLDSYNVG